MRLSEQVAIISEVNLNGLFGLYEEMNTDNLSRIINKHIETAIDELTEDLGMEKRVPQCKGCSDVKHMNYIHNNYYCDNENRTDDMGKLGADELPEISPAWCPKRNV